jgi:hypothetical protein
MQLDWLDILNKVFEVAVIPILGAATLYFIAFIDAKKKELKDKAKNEVTAKYIEMLDDTIINCVIATNQTYVDALKKAGSFDLEAQKHAFQLTYDAVMSILTDEAEMYLNEAIKDLNTYITNKIESGVVYAKP